MMDFQWDISEKNIEIFNVILILNYEIKKVRNIWLKSVDYLSLIGHLNNQRHYYNFCPVTL